MQIAKKRSFFFNNNKPKVIGVETSYLQIIDNRGFAPYIEVPLENYNIPNTYVFEIAAQFGGSNESHPTCSDISIYSSTGNIGCIFRVYTANWTMANNTNGKYLENCSYSKFAPNIIYNRISQKKLILSNSKTFNPCYTGTFGNSYSETINKIRLFAQSNDATTTIAGQRRIFFVKLYSDENNISDATLMLHLVPALDKDDIAVFYDLCTKKMFYPTLSPINQLTFHY